MSREVKRVPLDFPWTQQDGIWPGYLLGSICEAVDEDCAKCAKFCDAVGLERDTRKAALASIRMNPKHLGCPKYDNSIEPPAGEGWQVWETVSGGSPISPVFAGPEALARYMTTTRWGADHGTSYDAWLAFITGPGWAPSMVVTAEHGAQTGVQAAAND